MQQKYTPMMMQYLEIKKDYQDAFLFFRLGDFYEMFFEDAKKASVELDLVLTGRDAGAKDRVPMCGIPHHAAKNYISRLIAKGYKVAICEQVEDVSAAKGIVKRDVIKVITPGTSMDDFDDKENAYCCALIEDRLSFSLALVDMSTGELLVTNVEKELISLTQSLLSLNVKEIVVKKDFDLKLIKALKNNLNITISYEINDNLPLEYMNLVQKIDDSNLIVALGLLINYLLKTSKKDLYHLEEAVYLDDNSGMKMDYYTKNNLELLYTVKLHSRNGSLWNFLDQCKSSMGSRYLRKMIERPLTDLNAINHRLDCVQILIDNYELRNELRQNIALIYDLERLCAKIKYGNCNPKDLVQLKISLSSFNQIKNILTQLGPTYSDQANNFDECNELFALLDNSLVLEAPISIKEGGIFKYGYDQRLDELITISSNSKKWINDLENEQREKTKIKSLKIGYNKVFGYYIEVTKANLDLVKPEHNFIRKQTLANCERFITQELKEKEDLILNAEQKRFKLEEELFKDLVNKVQKELYKVLINAKIIAYVDIYAAFSELAIMHNYVRPNFNCDNKIEIKKGRHPIIETTLKNHRYVQNDLFMDENTNVLLITGPNMGGKSTYMRQCAIIAIMAQIGCFVCCESCNLPIFDKIFTRIGASDDLLSGQSTFMVEMVETNHALRNATKNSLILFDEIGRGTSTYDGMALAQAIIEYLTLETKAKTLFSTHYHELTKLEEVFTNLKNISVSVYDKDGEIVFLYTIKEEKADRSYGINVASLANLPQRLLDRAKDILVELEANNKKQTVEIVHKQELAKGKAIIEQLDRLDPINLTPMQALQILFDYKKQLEEEKND